MHKIGIDLGGTKLEGILLDEKLQVIERIRIPTDKESGYQAILGNMLSLINDLRKKAQDECIVGVCIPGTISPYTGKVRNSNTTCLIGKPLKDDLESMLHQTISMDNDANCFVMAEATIGAAKDFDTVFGVIMGTGVGGGIVINGSLHRGRTLIAGEWGHHTLHTGGNPCYCGHKGCVETYISGPALENRWTELTGRNEPLSIIVQKSSSDEVNKWKNEFLENFGRALANVIDILDPDAIVLGGGVSNVSFLYDEGKNAVYRNVFTDTIETPILKNQLGDSAGVFGAALLSANP
ncbi:MAG: ROK family protein [Thaumarchaeota archaeon]|nr:ROK family protein [Nitrososphaerota archaeon]